MRISLTSTRWAALGAAVAVTLGAGGIGIAGAAIGSGERTVFVPIEPCRILDTRPEFNIGPKTTPLGENETYSLKGVGQVGECNLPGDATGLALNATAVDATAPTFITIFATGADRPNASHLNPLPGMGATPNAVVTDLGAESEFSIFNRFGQVGFFADVLGYYVDHHHDDRYYTKQQADSRYPGIDDVYTKTETDALLAEPVPDRMLIPLSDFVPNGGQTLNSGWNGDASSVVDQCLRATPELPVGASIESIEVTYTSSSELNANALVSLTPLGAGPISAQVLFASSGAILPNPGAGNLGHATLPSEPITGPLPPNVTAIERVPSGEYSSRVELCVVEPVHGIRGVVLDLG